MRIALGLKNLRQRSSGSFTPTLSGLTLSSTTFIVGTASSGTILGATGGSTITASGLPTGLTINGTARTFAWDGTGTAATGSFTLTETLAGATGSPRTSAVGYAITSAVTLGSLTLSSASFTAGTPSSGTISGATSGSTITATGLPAGLTINGTARTFAWDGTGSASTGSLTLTEVLAGATNTPHDSSISYTINAASVTWGGAGTRAAPTLGYPSPIASNPTNIPIAMPADPQTGDVLKLAYSTSASISSPTILSHTITDADIVAGTFSMGLSAITFSGVTFFQALVSTGGVDSANLSNVTAWGDTVAPVISTSATQTITETTALAIALTATDTGGVPALVSDGVTPGWYIAGGADQLQYEIAIVSGNPVLRWFGNGSQTYNTAAGGQNAYVVSVGAIDYGGNPATPVSITTTVTAVDKLPDAYSFTSVSDATQSTVYTSNTITVAGLGAGVAAPVTISGGGQYSKNGGAFTSSAGTAQNGDTITLKVTSSASFAFDTQTVLNIGDGTATWHVTTMSNPSWSPADLFSGEYGFAFDPTDTGTFWQDSTAATAGSFTQPIGRLDDTFSGGSRHFSQATSTKRPTAVSPGWVQFDGSNDLLARTSTGLFASTSGVTIVYAISAASQTDKVFFAEQSTASNSPLYAPGTWADNVTGTHIREFARNDANAAYLDNPGTQTVFNGSPHVVTITDDRASTAIISAWVDRVAETPKDYTASGTFTANNTSLGALQRTTEGSWFNGKLGRFIAIARVLSPSEIAQAEAWCAAPYGVTLP